MNSLSIFKKINLTTSQARFKWTNDKLINLIKYLQEFDSSNVKFSFLSIDSFQWLQGFEVIVVININLLKNYKFRLFVDCSHLCFDLFLPRFRFSLLTFINFLFTRGYYISTRVEIVHIIVIFFNSVYRVELQPRWKSPYNQPLRDLNLS